MLCRKVGEKEKQAVSRAKVRGKEKKGDVPCTLRTPQEGRAGGKKAHTFLFSAIISISMWIYTGARAHTHNTRAEHARRGAPRLAGIYGRVRAGLVY